MKVKRLPGSAPESFSGAVGSMKMAATIDKNQVKANEALTLKVKISGSGNLKFTDQLNFNFPTDFEIYDPKISNNLKTTTAGVSGSKTFEYLLIPRHAGTYEIPPVEFSYFNPKSKKYEKIASQPFALNVERGDGDSDPTMVTAPTNSKEVVKMIGKDIRYIKTSGFNLQKEKNSAFFGSTPFYLSYFGSSMLFLGFVFYMRQKRKANENVSLIKHKKAGKVAQKQLKKAEAHLQAKDKDAFYKEVLDALLGYLSDKLGVGTSELNKENIQELLSKKGVEETAVSDLLDVWNECEFAQFAPVGGDDAMDKSFQKATDVINKIESSLRKS